MVSIHRVPVIAYLIIRVIYFTFRFNRGTKYNRSLHIQKAFALPDQSKRATSSPTLSVYIKPYQTQ